MREVQLTACTDPFFPDEETDDGFFAVTFNDGRLKFHGTLRPDPGMFKTEWRNYARHWVEELEGEEAAEVLAIGRPLIAYCCHDCREGSPPLLNADTHVDIRLWNKLLNNAKAGIKSKLVTEYGHIDAKYVFSIIWPVLVTIGRLVDKQDRRPVTSWEYTQTNGNENAAESVLGWLFRR